MEHSALGRRRIQRYQQEVASLMSRWGGLRSLRHALEQWPAHTGVPPAVPKRDELEREHSRIGRLVAERFPDHGSVLPTSLGNVIRAFENYPRRQYGMSAIALWPRLLAVVDKDYAAAIEDQRTSFDFMLNCSALACICAGLLVALGLGYPLPFAQPWWAALWLAETAGLLALAYLFYVVSIGRAMAWGQMVKGAFDLYRHALLRHLGYSDVPSTLEAERRV